MEFFQENLQRFQATAVEWLTSPAAYAQFALLIGAFILAWIVTGWLVPRLRNWLTPKPDDQSMLATARAFVAPLMPLLLPLLAYGFTAAGEQVTRALFDSGAVIAFGKRVFIFLAARIFVDKVCHAPFLKTYGKFVLVPIAGLYALGLLAPVSAALQEADVELGAISFTLYQVVVGAIAGALLIWLGRWSNDTGGEYIRRQESMRPSVRELAAKAFELAVYVAVALLIVNILQLPLGSLAVLGGAVGVGIGFGLQKIASNFVSGVILLLEGQATVGDYVELDGGEMGQIIKMTARATILETFDGRWIVVPNEDFITTRVVNYSDSGSANRLEVAFSVAYDSDLDQVIEVVRDALTHRLKGVLHEPELPDVEVDGFGDSGINMLAEFWVAGLDDGENKYTADARLLIWRVLKEHNIAIPFPQREIRILGGEPVSAPVDPARTVA